MEPVMCYITNLEVCVQESASHRHPGSFLPLLVNCEIASVVDALMVERTFW